MICLFARAPQSGQVCADTAGDVKPHASGGNDTTDFRIKSRNATDRESVSPVCIRHGIGGANDSWKGGNIDDLLADLIVHRADQTFLGVDDRGHAHRPGWLYAPFGF